MLFRRDATAQWIDRLVSSPAVRSGYVSLSIHLLLFILLAVFMLDSTPAHRRRPLVIAIGPEATGLAAADPPGPVAIDTIDDGDQPAAPLVPVPAPPEPSEPDQPPLVTVTPPPAMSAAQDAADLSPAQGDRATAAAVSGPPVQTISTKVVQPRGTRGARTAIVGGTAGTQGFAARKGEARAAAARSRGGSAASEAAVERGLEWLAEHQARNGSWQFDLSGCSCHGACSEAGTLTSATASTAIALLPFLGAGHTHREGRYQEAVSRAIYFLISCMKPTPRGGDFCEGTMYGHGVTTLALAEALGMTKDDMLEQPVREAVRFIETAQDLHGGGWRYLPGQPGDTTVTAWQVAALKSAQLAGLEAPSPTMGNVVRFLDSVEAFNGAAYGYRRGSPPKPCTSAIGLLCRMYTGWGTDDERLYRGVTNLAKQDPAPHAIYHNFYLAQALLQMNHPRWVRWNAKNRDQLVAQQARANHEAGSWFFSDRDTAPGGRLAHTALAILSLEVYYRLLPIYQQEAVESGF